MTASTVSNPAQEPAQPKYDNDPRLARLNEFFDQLDSPVQPLAADFLAAADLHELDWRLLPSLCIIETSGGKTAVRNNIFGWASARRGFSSVREGIYQVAERLAHSNLYKDKGLDAVLRTYNPIQGYPARVKRVMKQVDARLPLAVRQASSARLNPSDELQSTALLAPAR